MLPPGSGVKQEFRTRCLTCLKGERFWLCIVTREERAMGPVPDQMNGHTASRVLSTRPALALSHQYLCLKTFPNYESAWCWARLRLGLLWSRMKCCRVIHTLLTSSFAPRNGFAEPFWKGRAALLPARAISLTQPSFPLKLGGCANAPTLLYLSFSSAYTYIPIQQQDLLLLPSRISEALAALPVECSV